MNTHAEKTQENKSKAVANDFSQKQKSSESAFQLVDIRQESIAQRKLQELINNSSQVKNAAQLQSMADNYAAKQQQPIQKKENKTGLPNNLKSGIEDLSGYPMNDVKVHYKSAKPTQLQAHAYAQGSDIHVAVSGQDQYLPYEVDPIGGSLINDEKNPIQRRTIKGTITSKKVGKNWQVKPLGASAPPNLSINPSPQVAIGGGINKTVILGVDDFMRGHLVKAAWEGKNKMEQMTQWRLRNEEVEWTNIEAAAENMAVANAGDYKGKSKILTHNVKTEANEPNIGNRLLGTDTNKIPVKWLKREAKANAGTRVIVNNIRTELNRMVNTATMYVGKDKVGEIKSEAHNDLKIK